MTEELIRVPKAFTKEEVNQEIVHLLTTLRAITELLKVDFDTFIKTEKQLLTNPDGQLRDDTRSVSDADFDELFDYLNRTQITLEDLQNFVSAREKMSK